MTFRAQVRWCRKWGVVAAVTVPLLLGLAMVLPGLGALFDVLILLVLAVAASLLVFGGFVRPIQKALYHRFSEDWPFYRRFAALSPLRHWLWVTPEGKDRDA